TQKTRKDFFRVFGVFRGPDPESSTKKSAPLKTRSTSVDGIGIRAGLLLVGFAFGFPIAGVGIAVPPRAFDFAFNRIAADLAVIFRGNGIAASLERGAEGNFVALHFCILDFNIAGL